MFYFLKIATLFAATILLCSAANAGSDPCEAHLYELRPDLPLTHPSFQYLINDGSIVVSYPEPILPILTFFIPYPADLSDKNPDSFNLYYITPEFLECKEIRESKGWKGWCMLYNLAIEYSYINHVFLALHTTREDWDRQRQRYFLHPEWFIECEGRERRWDAMDGMFALDPEKRAHLKVIFARFTLNRIALLEETARSILTGGFHEGQASLYIEDLSNQLKRTRASIEKYDTQEDLSEEIIRNLSEESLTHSHTFLFRAWGFSSVVDFIRDSEEDAINWSLFPKRFPPAPASK